MRVLIVEDDKVLSDGLSRYLQQSGYVVDVAANGTAADTMLATEEFGLAILDIGLPGMDGYDFLRRARQLPAAARIPALALTGYGQDSDIRRAHDAGYAGHFVKPVNIEVLDQQLLALVVHDSAPRAS